MRTDGVWQSRKTDTVTVVVPDFDPTVGGTSRQSRQQVEDLLGRGVSALVLTRRRRRGWPAREIVQGVEVRRLYPPGWGSLADKGSVASVALWLAMHGRHIAMVEVVMYPDYALSSVFGGLGDRTVMIWAGLGDATDTLGPSRDPLRRAQRALRRHALRRCRHVALTSAIEKELRSLGIDRIERIGVPVDTDRFHPPTTLERSRARADLGLTDDVVTVVYSGHLRASKGIDSLIEAFSRLIGVRERARLYIVGKGSGPDASEEELRRQVTRLGLETDVVFTGAVERVERYLWAADMFVLPSRREGMSNSLLEAMACGLACVAGPEAGGDEMLADGAGEIPASNGPDDLLLALRQLADDPGRRDRLGRAAHLRVREMSCERVGDRYFALYQELTGARS